MKIKYNFKLKLIAMKLNIQVNHECNVLTLQHVINSRLSPVPIFCHNKTNNIKMTLCYFNFTKNISIKSDLNLV